MFIWEIGIPVHIFVLWWACSDWKFCQLAILNNIVMCLQHGWGLAPLHSCPRPCARTTTPRATTCDTTSYWTSISRPGWWSARQCCTWSDNTASEWRGELCPCSCWCLSTERWEFFNWMHLASQAVHKLGSASSGSAVKRYLLPVWFVNTLYCFQIISITVILVT